MKAYVLNAGEESQEQKVVDKQILDSILSSQRNLDNSLKSAFTKLSDDKTTNLQNKLFGFDPKSIPNDPEQRARLEAFTELTNDDALNTLNQALQFTKTTSPNLNVGTIQEVNAKYEEEIKKYQDNPTVQKDLIVSKINYLNTEALKLGTVEAQTISLLLDEAATTDASNTSKLRDLESVASTALNVADKYINAQGANKNDLLEEYNDIKRLQAELIVESINYQGGVDGWLTLSAQDQAKLLRNSEYNPEDSARVLLNSRKYTPQALLPDGAGTVKITRVDNANYAAVNKDSKTYIAPLDGSYISDGETFYFNTENPSASKFTIQGFSEADDENNNPRDGIQQTYVINYTAGDLSRSNGSYSFTADGLTPSLLGYDPNELDTALKYVSEADLMAYGATAVSGEIGSQIFTWPDPLSDSIKTDNNLALTDLDGNIITKAGWYDFTRRSIDGDGGRFIYGTYTNENGWTISTDNDPSTEEGQLQRIIGLELRFTDNMFGDKDPTPFVITDPFGTGQATGSEAEIDFARNAEGKSLINTQELNELRNRPQSVIATVLTQTQAQILEENQRVVDADFEISNRRGDYIEPSSINFIQDRSFGIDDPGYGAGDFAAMSLNDGVDSVAGDSFAEGQGISNSTSSDVDEQITTFLEGEGESDGDAEEARGQNAEGQGQGEGGEAALGEDQSPKTQRKRGLLLQPIVQQSVDEDQSQSSSRVLKNLSEGSVLGNNLLDALTLGGGILYALYAPQLVQTSRKSFRSFFSSLQQRFNGGSVVIPEKNVASVFVMKRPDGTERLVAARITPSAIDIIAQQDLPTGVSVLQSGNQTQIDYGMKQLLSRIGGSLFDLLLIGPRLSNQATLTQSLSSDVQVLDTSGIESRLRTCSEAEVTELRQWLDKPSSTPLEQNPLNDLLTDRQISMESMLKKEQASMAGLLELSIALSWKDSK